MSKAIHASDLDATNYLSTPLPHLKPIATPSIYRYTVKSELPPEVMSQNEAITTGPSPDVVGEINPLAYAVQLALVGSTILVILCCICKVLRIACCCK